MPTRQWFYDFPYHVRGLRAWYDFSDISTLWKDTARTSAVTTDADVIKGVTDKSGRGQHLQQATTGIAPTYETNEKNGRSIARFGTADADTVMTAVTADNDWDFGAGPGGRVTVCVVLKPSSTAPNVVAGVCGTNGLNTARDGWYLDFQQSGGYRVSYSNGDATSHLDATSSAITYNTYQYVTGSWVPGTENRVYINGVDSGNDVTTTGVPGDPPHNEQGLMVGSIVGGFPPDMDLGELIIYDQRLSSTSRADVEAYLQRRWGI